MTAQVLPSDGLGNAGFGRRGSLGDQPVRLTLVDGLLTEGLVDLRANLSELVPGGTRTLVVDLSAVERLSSTCVASLLWVKRTCRSRGVRVVLTGPSERTLGVLTRTGLSTVFEIESEAS